MARKNKPRKRRPQRDLTPEAESSPSAVVHVTAQTTKLSFSGPIPPPEILEAYDRVMPGSPERILTMAEKQSTHRMKIEVIVVQAGSRNQLLGMVCAFILSLVIIGFGASLIYQNKNLEGFSLVLSDLVILAGLFIYGKHTQRKELKASRAAFK